MVETADFYLPNECWESIIAFINDDDDGKNNHGRYLKSLSVVSKQFLIITNRLRSSLNLYNPTHPFLYRLFKRFTNLTSLDFRCFQGDLNALLSQISCFRLNLKSLNLSNQPTIPADGLRAFSRKITTLTSLICSNIGSIQSSDFFLILNCFRLLEELDLSNPLAFKLIYYLDYYKGGFLEVLSLALPKIRKFNLSGHYYLNDDLIFRLFKNWRYLEEAILLDNYQITITGIASALSQRPTLRSLSLSFSSTSGTAHFKKKITSPFMDSLVSLKSLTCLDLKSLNISDELLTSISVEGLPLRRLVLQYCTGYSFVGIFHLLSKCRCIQHLDLQNADFLNDQHVVQLSSLLDNLVSINLNECKMVTKSGLCALIRNCTSLSEIKMKSIGSKSVEDSNSSIVFGVYPQLKSLSLAGNSWLNDEIIVMFASVFPNLQLLDLASCHNISESICQILKICRKIRHLNLAYCLRVNLLGINFELPKLEVLNLTFTMVDDETLYVISKNCRGLLQLSLDNCFRFTMKGVEHVVENCTQLREINLRDCNQVHGSVVVSMVLSRPSLRKITAPRRYCFNDREMEFFLHQGCIVC